MSAPLLRSFDRLEAATAARDELVAAGFPPSALEVRVMEDEAGPMEGNFTVGNGLTENSSRAESNTVSPGSGNLYEANFGNSAQRSGNLLMVSVVDEAQRQQALAVLDRFGAAGSRGGSASAARPRG